MRSSGFRRIPEALVLLTLFFFVAGTDLASATPHSCAYPRTWRLGKLDPRFNLSREEVRVLVQRAARTWELAVGHKIFQETSHGSIVVNFIYGEPQVFAEAQGQINHEVQSLNEDIEALNREVDVHQRELERLNQKMTALNLEVLQWNQSGGGSQAAFRNLQRRKTNLDREINRVNARAEALRTQAHILNSKQESLQTSNQRLLRERMGVKASGRASIDPDYGGLYRYDNGEESIQIYQFETPEKLTSTIAHELGHALGLQHLAAGDALMNATMTENNAGRAGISRSDLYEYYRVCGKLTR